jgi:hypothetical protein
MGAPPRFTTCEVPRYTIARRSDSMSACCSFVSRVPVSISRRRWSICRARSSSLSAEMMHWEQFVAPSSEYQ